MLFQWRHGKHWKRAFAFRRPCLFDCILMHGAWLFLTASPLLILFQKTESCLWACWTSSSARTTCGACLRPSAASRSAPFSEALMETAKVRHYVQLSKSWRCHSHLWLRVWERKNWPCSLGRRDNVRSSLSVTATLANHDHLSVYRFRDSAFPQRTYHE